MSDQVTETDSTGSRGPRLQPREIVSCRFIGVRVTPAERDRARRLAAAEETTLSDICREALDEYARRRGLS